MKQRSIVGLGASILLVACTGNTTSLGGADPATSRASSSDEDSAEARTPVVSSPSSDEADTDEPTLVCHGYSWDPVPSAVPCEYLLPSGPPPSGDPRLDPKTWQPRKVSVVISKWDAGAPRHIGQFISMRETCGDSDGWYYVDPGDRSTPTLFALCPTSCDRVQEENSFLRLDADTFCDYY